MVDSVKAIRKFTVRTALPQALAGLADLANNLRWSWHVPTRDLFKSIDPQRWDQVHHDPVALLGQLTPDEWQERAETPEFVERVNTATESLRRYLDDDRWYQENHPNGPAAIAYFSPEYGVAHVLPQYSGGLGILAGDHLKSASDLGLPLIGVGLLYTSGYFTQSLTRDGWQTETYPVIDPAGLPLQLVREDNGQAAMVTVQLPGGRSLHAYIWKAAVGRVPLLLLDSDIPENDDHARSITDRLYGGEGEHRIQQEMLLGIGGVRALRTWSRITGAPMPAVHHSNEGHAGFSGLERIREHMNSGLSFDEAREAVRAGTIFTTHTPVAAGVDRFSTELVARYLGESGALDPVPTDQLLELGSEPGPEGDAGVFNMAVMGLRLAQRSNGVSTLHGQSARAMFQGLWPGFDLSEVPVTSITNGVHAPTWVHPHLVKLAAQHIGTDKVFANRGWDQVTKVPAEALWECRGQLRAELVDYARTKLTESWRNRGATQAELGWVSSALDPEILTIGFARRAPRYKRLTLMLHDPERLKRILLDPERPVQIVIAGKSHPADEQGKSLIQEVVQFADDPEVRHRIVFLPNYGIEMALKLYPGCDVWLNNPLRPQEACGTSGMKAALNGGLNLSILDGWWDEYFDGENGWAIPTAEGLDDPQVRDELEANALYEILENSVAPKFYDRDEQGVPRRWMAMVQNTLQGLGPKVLANRMVREYTERLYLPANQSQVDVAQDDYHVARDLAAWKSWLMRKWAAVHIDHVESSGLSEAPQTGDVLRVSAWVGLGELSEDDVVVEAVCGRVSETDDIVGSRTTVTLRHVESFGGGKHRYEGEVKIQLTGSFGYSVRILPFHQGLSNLAETGMVTNA